MNWNEIVGQVYRFLVGLATHPNAQVGIVKNLGSGINVENERKQNKDKLVEICESIVNDPDLISRDTDGNGSKETFCNVAVRKISEHMGCYDFNDGMLANRMIEIMMLSSKWVEDEGIRAQAHACKGGLAIAAKQGQPHGHVAVIYPKEEIAFSGSWNKQIPWVANVGKINQIMKTSEAFAVKDGEPQYFLWGEV